MAKTLFISDLDGTLLSSDSRLSANTVAMLNEAISKGALFSVATARTPSTVAILLKDVEARLPFIVMTGAAVWNPLDKTFSHPVTMKQETAESILATIHAHSLPAFIYTLKDNVIHIYHTDPLSEGEKNFISERDDSIYKVFHIAENGCSDIPARLDNVVLFYAMQPSDIVESTYNDIRAHNDCNAVFYHDIYGPEIGLMEIFAPGASKADALKWLKLHTGADRVAAFGDNINDIPMLRVADVAIAVENAVEEVKEVADIIIGPNTSDSVAQFILEAITAGNSDSADSTRNDNL